MNNPMGCVLSGFACTIGGFMISQRIAPKFISEIKNGS